MNQTKKQPRRTAATTNVSETDAYTPFVIDNGAYTMKCGFNTSTKPKIVPNCVMKVKSERRRFIASQIQECADVSGLFYQLAYERGYLINWDIQKTVWDYTFDEDNLNVNFDTSPVIFTEPIFNFRPIQEGITEIFFEEYECPYLLRVNAPDLSAFKYKMTSKYGQCCVIVDVGYSFTHIVPYINGKKVKSAIRRIDVGGKLLTNQLKEIVSYRQLDVMDETYVMNQCKEDCCYVSLDFKSDMHKTVLDKKLNPIIREYVLPDYNVVKRGYIREPGKIDPNQDNQILLMNNERITIPEILFHPSDIGLDQKGVSRALVESVLACPEKTHWALFANIIVTGGCAKFPNFGQRLKKDVRECIESIYDVEVIYPNDPITFAYEGGVSLSTDSQFYGMCVKKSEYDEVGFNVALKKFDV